MENASINQSANKPNGNRICSSLVILAIGILIGGLVTKYVWHGSPSTRAGMRPGQGSPIASAVGLRRGGALTQSEEWNPIDQMSNIQAEIDRVFQRSLDDLRLNPKLNVFQKGAWLFAVDGRAGFERQVSSQRLPTRHEDLGRESEIGRKPVESERDQQDDRKGNGEKWRKHHQRIGAIRRGGPVEWRLEGRSNESPTQRTRVGHYGAKSNTFLIQPAPPFSMGK